MSGELLRKTIHLGSLSIPIVYYYIARETALWILVPLTILSIFIDRGRFYWPWLNRTINKVFDPILREHERDSEKKLLSGATYVLISALLCVLVFPKLITVTAFAILIISDASSALVGRAIGKHKFLDKSLEGTTAFILSAWIVVAVVPKAENLPIEYVIAGLAAVIGGIAEAASVRLRLDDNFSVPASIGLVMWACYFFLSQQFSEYATLYSSLIAVQ